jgi:DNA replication protein DnaC
MVLGGIQMTNENKCILKGICKNAGILPFCSSSCSFYNSIKGRIRESNIPKDYERFTITHNPVRDTQREAFEMIDLWAKLSFPRIHQEDGERIRPLYLYSAEPGTGKTAAACSILNSYLIYHFIHGLKKDKNEIKNITYFLDFNGWQRTFSEFNHPSLPRDMKEDISRKFYQMRESAKNTRLLVIDDIGIQTPTEAFGAVAHDLINHRVSNRLPTIFTSNVPMNHLITSYDVRLFDRIRDQNTEIIFEGKSKRGKRSDFV